MGFKDLLLKTVFCCMACDSDISPEEVDKVREMAEKHPLLKDLDVESIINKYIQEINNEGSAFLSKYLNDLKSADLSTEEALCLAEIAIEIIEADDVIEYSEIKFFKKIRKELKFTNDEFLSRFPDKEIYLLPDIISVQDIDWTGHFDSIRL